LLGAARQREDSASRPALTEAEANKLKDKVQALLDGDRLSEAVNLLEDGVQRAAHGSVLELRVRYFLAATLFYAGEYTRAASLFDTVGRDYRRLLPPNDPYVLECAYHAGHAYAEIGKPEKALSQLRFYIQNFDASADSDGPDKVLETRFVIAQMLATVGYPDEALSELEAVRVLVADSFGASSTQIRNLDKQISRLRSITR
jgi:tetratricopeptide (TPR) repeat protein